jgi:hypothetical protein
MDAPASLLIHGDNPRAPDPSPPVHNALNPNPADVEAVESFLRSPPPTLGSLVEILKYTPALSEFENLPTQLLHISDLVASLSREEIKELPPVLREALFLKDEYGLGITCRAPLTDSDAEQLLALQRLSFAHTLLYGWKSGMSSFNIWMYCML